MFVVVALISAVVVAAVMHSGVPAFKGSVHPNDKKTYFPFVESNDSNSFSFMWCGFEISV